MTNQSRRFLRSCKQFYCCDIRAAEQTFIRNKLLNKHRPKVTWCVKVLCRHSRRSRLCTGATSNHAEHVIGCWPSADPTAQRSAVQRNKPGTFKPNKQKKNVELGTGSGCVCGRGHISVSANKLSPRPDVSKTICGPESVG